MGSRQRLYAIVEPGHERRQRAIRFRCLDDDSADRCKHVLDAVVELSKQRTLMLLRSFAVGDIDVNANDALRTAIAVVRHEVARLDPSNLAARTNNSILCTILLPPIAEGAAPELLHAPEVLRVHTGLPLTAFDLGCPIGETVNGCVAFRGLDFFRAGVEREAADEGGFAGHRQLQVALDQRS